MNRFQNVDIWCLLAGRLGSLTEKFQELAPEAARALDKAWSEFLVSHFIPEMGERDSGFPRRINFIRKASLPPQPPPELVRPVLFLHGYNAAVTEFKEMTIWLASTGKNGDGGCVRVADLDQMRGNAKLFRMEFTAPFQPIHENVAEIEAVVQAICQATGSERLDLVAHSKGGLDARAYVDMDDARVERVVTVGTPHLGAELAEIFYRMRQNMTQDPLDCDNSILRSDLLREFFVDRVDADGRVNNPVLHRLNENWPRQSRRVRFLALGGAGFLTCIPQGATMRGDGIVALTSALGLPGAAMGIVNGVIHNHLAATQAVMLQTASFLTQEKV